MIFGQVALAQHNASHVDHGFSQEVAASHDAHDKHQHEQNDNKHECPECLLTETLQTAFYNTSSALPFILQTEVLASTQKNFTIGVKSYKANAVRAPPAFLI